jgi:hypothetical protein
MIQDPEVGFLLSLVLTTVDLPSTNALKEVAFLWKKSIADFKELYSYPFNFILCRLLSRILAKVTMEILQYRL